MLPKQVLLYSMSVLAVHIAAAVYTQSILTVLTAAVS
jgi:hypothetical protein